MAKTLAGAMRSANVTPNIMKTAASAGVLLDRRHEAGIGWKYAQDVGQALVAHEVSIPLQRTAPEVNTEEVDPDEIEKVLADAEFAGAVATSIVELDLQFASEDKEELLT